MTKCSDFEHRQPIVHSSDPNVQCLPWSRACILRMVPLEAIEVCYSWPLLFFACFSQFPSMYQENESCCSLDLNCRGSSVSMLSARSHDKSPLYFSHPLIIPNLYTVCCLKVSTRVLLCIFCLRVASSDCQTYLQ